MLEQFNQLSHAYDPETAELDGGETVERRLADLRGAFADSPAFESRLERENPLLYRVTAVAPADSSGHLHYGLGVLYPGKVGDEYFLTKGHLHERREAAEVYIGLRGQGALLLEDEATGESRLESFGAGKVVYVPGHTAHRTVNTGAEPLTYFGVFPSDAGHDYGAIAVRNFLKVVIEKNGRAVLEDRPKADQTTQTIKRK